MENQKLYIEQGDCDQCYRCIRVCPVKAIQMCGTQASIDDSLCVGCSLCEGGCPQGLIKSRSVVQEVEQLIDSGASVVASLHWSWFLHFGDVSSGAVCAAFKELGFDSVSEALWGLTLYNETLKNILASSKNHGLIISSECAVARSMVQRHFGELDDCVADVANAMTLHARLIRAWYKDQGVKVVYVAPCAGYVDYVEHGDLVISFDQLKEWISSRVINLSDTENCQSEDFYPAPCPWVAPLQPKDNVIRTYNLDDACRLLSKVNKQDNVVLDLMACTGCVANCSFEAQWRSVADYMSARRHFAAKQYLEKQHLPQVDTSAIKQDKSMPQRVEVGQLQITEALESLAKFQPYDHHNCNACGYGTCVDFARAMVRGMVTREMCLSYSRSQMYRKYTALIERMPSGVMLVDGDMKVIQANANMARIMGGDAKLVYDASRGLKGADVTKLVSFSEMIIKVLESGVDALEVEVEHDQKLLRVSVFSVEKGKTVCVVASNLLLGDVLDNQIIVQTQQAIEENQKAVQQIAQLLGQSAARTQRVLHTITLKRK